MTSLQLQEILRQHTYFVDVRRCRCQIQVDHLNCFQVTYGSIMGQDEWAVHVSEVIEDAKQSRPEQTAWGRFAIPEAWNGTK